MKKTTTQAIKISEFEFLLEDLNPCEASELTGGYEITNTTTNIVRFYTFSDAVVPTQRTLAPGASNSFNSGTHVLYDSNPALGSNAFNPVIGEVVSDGTYSFVEQDGIRTLVGFAFVSAEITQ
jgi:hypothetical protein